jgi:hypothetical protein
MKRLLACLCLLLTAVPAADAWNAVGHRAIAALAYDNLNKRARARVDQLIRRHPDYSQWIQGAPPSPRQRARFAFTQAAVWADNIKGDARFYDEARRDAKPTPTLAGFPDMKQHRNWHYINVAFSTDGTALPKEPPTPNALTELTRIIPLLPSDEGVYLLPWFLHIAGDVHQPLHCATRFRQGQNDPQGRPWSDLGGNTVHVVGAHNLHAFWDDALGIVDSDTYIDELAKFLSRQPKEKPVVTDPKTWINEGARIAQDHVYSFGNEGGSKDNPIRLDSNYVQKSRTLSRQRAALAAYRIAAILNQQLQ